MDGGRPVTGSAVASARLAEERTGLHEPEFIETRRHWFTGPVPHETQGSVNVLNLVEARRPLESPTGAFAPFVVHYAETFIVPPRSGRTQCARPDRRKAAAAPRSRHSSD